MVKAQEGSVMASRKRYSHEFKKQVVEELERGAGTAQELGRKHNVHPISIYQWAKKFREGTLVDRPSQRERKLEKKLAEAERQIGKMALAIALLKKLQAENSQSQKRFVGYRQLLAVASTAKESPAK